MKAIARTAATVILALACIGMVLFISTPTSTATAGASMNARDLNASPTLAFYQDIGDSRSAEAGVSYGDSASQDCQQSPDSFNVNSAPTPEPASSPVNSSATSIMASASASPFAVIKSYRVNAVSPGILPSYAVPAASSSAASTECGCLSGQRCTCGPACNCSTRYAATMQYAAAGPSTPLTFSVKQHPGGSYAAASDFLDERGRRVIQYSDDATGRKLKRHTKRSIRLGLE